MTEESAAKIIDLLESNNELLRNILPFLYKYDDLLSLAVACILVIIGVCAALFVLFLLYKAIKKFI